MRLSLTICLLVAATAIAGNTSYHTHTESCRAVLDSAPKKSDDILPLWDITDYLTNAAEPFPHEAFLKIAEPILVDICAAKGSRKDALEDILRDIDDECGKDLKFTNKARDGKDPRKLIKARVAGLDALCYVERDEKDSLHLVALNNPWIFMGFEDGLWNTTPDSSNFRCTTGNQHVLGTINQVAEVRKVVEFAKVECPEEKYPKLNFVKGLASATGAPYPEAQQAWEVKHKLSGESLNEESRTWGRRLDTTKDKLQSVEDAAPEKYSKNSATSTSIPAISGFLSLAFLASQY